MAKNKTNSSKKSNSGSKTAATSSKVKAKTKSKIPKTRKIKNQLYESELAKMQIELVKLQEWIKHKGLKVVVILMLW